MKLPVAAGPHGTPGPVIGIANEFDNEMTTGVASDREASGTEMKLPVTNGIAVRRGVGLVPSPGLIARDGAGEIARVSRV
jgi:hypothetical protein